MSTLSTINVKHPSSASNNLVLDSSGNVTGAGTLAMASSFLRNRIINGDMRIDQRNAGASVTLGTGAAYITDRWAASEDSDGAMTAQQSSSVVPTGFVNSLGFTTTTADASLSATRRVLMGQKIEGFNVADLGWGTASAQTITVSFFVRSSLTGTFGAVVKNSGSPAYRSYPFTYVINAANTWEYKTVTIPGDTSGTWLTNNGIGIELGFGLGVGSTYSGPAGSWATADYNSVTGAVSVIGTLNATWYITGVQLEVGSVATPFERRQYGQELALCQRYYSSGETRWDGYATNTVAYSNMAYVPMTMRVAPTVALTSTANIAFPTTVTALNITPNSFAVYRTANATANGAFVTTHTASAEL